MPDLRTWRTIRHLTPAQMGRRAVCRGRFFCMRAFPAHARRLVERHARRLPRPDPAHPRLGPVARRVLQWQRTVHGRHLDGIPGGRFTLLGRTVDFGGLERVEWRRDLGEGNVVLWRMHLSYFGYAAPLLAAGGESALDTVRSLLRSLERQNPFSAPGVFRDVWNPYSASQRLVNLLAGLHLFLRNAPRRSGAAGRNEAALASVLGHVRFCAAFVRRNLERDLGYNHLLKNHAALAAYACAAGGLPKAWRFLNRAAPRCVASQVLDDGGHAERSPMYHVLAMLDLLALADAGVLGGRATRSIDARVARMRRALAVMTHPDGEVALFNDAWLGETPPARTLAAERPAASPGPEVLEDSGYVRLRSGGDAAIFDCGPCGPDDNPAHAHADFLAAELSVAGRRFLVDYGVPTYSAGPRRDRARSAGAHNGPRFSGVEPLESWLSFRVGRRGRARRIAELDHAPETPLWCAGRHDGYRPIAGAVARCLALYPGRGVLIVDVWRGAAGREALADFLVSGAWRPSGPGRFAFPGAAGADVAFEAVAGAVDDLAPARHWPRFGEPRPAHRLRVRPAGAGARRWAAVWIGWGGTPPAAEAPSVRDTLFNAVAAAGGLRGRAA